MFSNRKSNIDSGDNHSSDRYDESGGDEYWGHDDRARGERRGGDRRGSERRDYDDRSRDYSRDYGRNSPPSRRSRSPPRRRRSPEPASNKIMLTQMPAHIDRDSMNIILSQQGFNPVDVRVIRKTTDSGGTRAFGFVEFATLTEARKYIEHNNGVLVFDDGFESRLEYARENDSNYASDRRAFAQTDWIAQSITSIDARPASNAAQVVKSLINLKRKDIIMSAANHAIVTREVAKADAMRLRIPALLVRELPLAVSEAIITQSISAYTNIPLQRIHIAPSGKYCLVQLRSVEDANYLLTTFNRTVPYILNCAVIVTYSRASLNKILLADGNMCLGASSNAAQLAQNAIQIAQLGRMSAANALHTISTPLGVFQQFAKPDQRTFQRDPNTDYFYDASTGYYYDAKTGFYFNNTTQQWCFWTTKFGTYIPVEGHEPELRKRLQLEERDLQRTEEGGDRPEATANTEASETQGDTEAAAAAAASDARARRRKRRQTAEEDDQPKQQSAQDIQRQMFKWAKKQEKIKLTIKKPDVDVASGADAAFSKAWTAEEDAPDAATSTESAVAASATDAARSTSSAADIETASAALEPATKPFDMNDYLDWTKLACMLCQRQFKSVEVLEKHCQKSELHKTNLANKIAELGIVSQASSASSLTLPKPQYRDRARERRALHGLDPGLDEPGPDASEAEIQFDATRRAVVPLDDTNVGKKLLKNMGWDEGRGLGRNQQGIVEPIKAEQRTVGVGLGAANSKTATTHRERVYQSTVARFNDIRD